MSHSKFHNTKVRLTQSVFNACVVFYNVHRCQFYNFNWINSGYSDIEVAISQILICNVNAPAVSI